MIETEQFCDPFSIAVATQRVREAGKRAELLLRMFPDQEALEASEFTNTLISYLAGGGEIPEYLKKGLPLVTEADKRVLNLYFARGSEDPTIERLADATVNNIVLGVAEYLGIDAERIGNAAHFYIYLHSQFNAPVNFGYVMPE